MSVRRHGMAALVALACTTPAAEAVPPALGFTVTTGIGGTGVVGVRFYQFIGRTLVRRMGVEVRN